MGEKFSCVWFSGHKALKPGTMLFSQCAISLHPHDTLLVTPDIYKFRQFYQAFQNFISLSIHPLLFNNPDPMKTGLLTLCNKQ